MGTPEHVDYLRERRWLDFGSGRRGHGRGGRSHGRGRGSRGRGRGRGGRGQRGNLVSFGAGLKEVNANSIEKTTRKYTRRGRTRGRGLRRGRRSFRPRQIPESRVPIIKEPQLNSFDGMRSRAKSYVEESRSLVEDDWGLEEKRRPYVEDDDNCVESESDDPSQASGDEYEDQVAHYDGAKRMGLLDDDTEEEDEAEEDGDEEGEEDLGYQVGQEDLDAEDDDDDEEMGDEDVEVGDGMANGDADEGAMSFSSEYSD